MAICELTSPRPLDNETALGELLAHRRRYPGRVRRPPSRWRFSTSLASRAAAAASTVAAFSRAHDDDAVIVGDDDITRTHEAPAHTIGVCTLPGVSFTVPCALIVWTTREIPWP